MTAVTENVADLRTSGLQCGKPLAKGRSCVHVKGHDGKCSYSWNGTSGHVFDAGLLIDTSTGEVIDVPRYHHSKFEMPAREHALDWLLRLSGANRFSLISSSATPDAEAGILWDFQGEHIKTGYDARGHLVAKDVQSMGRAHRIYSVNEKRAAVDLALKIGIRGASRKLDIPRTSIQHWATNGLEDEKEHGGNRRPANSAKPCIRCRKRVTTRLDGKPMCRQCWDQSAEHRQIRQDNERYFHALRDAATTEIPE